jgi:hypothetical protein
MANENEEVKSILDFIPIELRPQLELEVLESIEERKRLEREKALKGEKISTEKMVDQLMPGYKKH